MRVRVPAASSNPSVCPRAGASLATARVSALALLSLAAACSSSSNAPERTETVATAPKTAQFENPGGMWVPAQLGTEAHRKTLKSIGLELDPASLADPLAYPLGAIVHLGGCSASFVSPDGLIATCLLYTSDAADE